MVHNRLVQPESHSVSLLGVRIDKASLELVEGLLVILEMVFFVFSMKYRKQVLRNRAL